jgi:uncharacterized protein (TIGR02996 family)
MSADDDFLAAIRETPADDTPRLVYADWLEEHGQPDRAEFIRVQCRLATGVDVGPERRALLKREYELLADHWSEWAGPLVGVAPGEGARGAIREKGRLVDGVRPD